MLDLSGCTGLGTSLDLTGMHADVVAVVAPASVTGTLTMPNTVVTLTAPNTLTTLAATPNALTTINLTGSTSAIPSWALGNTNTGATATLNLSAMTGLGTTLSLSTAGTDITVFNVPTTVTTLTLPAHATTLTAGTALTTLTAGPKLATVNTANALTSITLTGDGGGAFAAVGGWLNTTTNTGASAVVDLSGITNFGGTSIAINTNTDIDTLKIPTSVISLNVHAGLTTLEAGILLGTLTTATNALTSVTLTGVGAGNLTAMESLFNGTTNTAASCVFNFSAATSVGTAVDLSSNSEITTLKVPTTITSITANAAVTTLECGSGVTTLTGPNALTSVTVAGSDAAIPSVFTADASRTASPCVLDVTGMTAITAVNLSSNADIKTLKMTYPRLIHAGMTSVNLGSCTNLTLTGGTNVSDVDISKPTSATSVTTLDLTGMGLAAAPTINHITDGFTAVTTISAAGSGLSDVTNIERNYSKTTITRTASPTSVTR